MSRIADLLAADATARWLGVELEAIDPLSLTMTVEDRHTNFFGVTHGGVVFAFADVAMSLASNVEQHSVAINAHVVLSGASRPGDRLHVVVENRSASRRLASYRAAVTCEDRTVADFTGTVYRPPPRTDETEKHTILTESVESPT